MDLNMQDRTEFLGPRGTLHTFTNGKGLTIASYHWPSIGETKAVLHFCHGHGAYLCFDVLKSRGPGTLNAYEGSWIQALNQAGYSVCGIDNQGAGRSGGERCYADNFDDYVAAVVQHMNLVPSLNLEGFPAILRRDAADAAGNGDNIQTGSDAFQKGSPRFLIGASMGGCLATMIALKLPEVVSGVVLLAPMLSLEKVAQKGANKYLKFLAPVISGLFPKWAVAATSKNTLYPNLQEIYDKDPNCWHQFTRARNAYEYMRVTHWLMTEGMEQVKFPFLVFHGLRDDMTDVDGSKALHERAQSQDKSIKLLNHMWHILMKEPGNEGILADVIDWIDTRSQQHWPPGAKDSSQLVSKLRHAASEALKAVPAKFTQPTAADIAVDAQASQ